MFHIPYSFADFYRETRNGGKHGYKSIIKELDGSDTNILCMSPGYEGCPESSTVPDYQPLIEHAITAIRDGILSGFYTSSGYTFTWLSNTAEIKNSRIVVR